MAVTHADLAIGRSYRALGSKLATCMMVVCSALGMLAFVFGLVAEITRTEVIWMSIENKNVDDLVLKCMYTSNGRSTMLSACGSLLTLVMAMGIGNVYMWMALFNPPASDRFGPLMAWTLSDSTYFRILRWQAVISFVSSWICFAAAAVLLIIGIAVESGHRKAWDFARDKCLVVRVGLFAAGGVFALFATSLYIAFYVIGLQTQRLQEEEAKVRQEVTEAAMYYSSSSPAPSSIQELPHLPDLPNQTMFK